MLPRVCCTREISRRPVLLSMVSNRSEPMKKLHHFIRGIRPSLERYLDVESLDEGMMYDGVSGLLGLLHLWGARFSFSHLSEQQRLVLKLEEMLRLWEKVLYLIIFYIQFSEFSSRLRPPCTTMPWTIWPALVVLWGVCWMFYGEYGWSVGDQADSWLLEDVNTMTVLTGKDPSSFASPDAKFSTRLEL